MPSQAIRLNLEGAQAAHRISQEDTTLGEGFTAMPEMEPMPMIAQSISAWTLTRAVTTLWLAVQRGLASTLSSAGGEASS